MGTQEYASGTQCFCLGAAGPDEVDGVVLDASPCDGPKRGYGAESEGYVIVFGLPGA